MKITPGMTEKVNATGQSTAQGKGDPKIIAQEAETVFLNEILKVMMEQTSFGKDQTISSYMPFITTEIAKSIAQRGIGIGDFILRNPAMEKAEEDGQKGSEVGVKGASHASKKVSREEDSKAEWDGKLRFPVSGRIASGFGLRHDPLDGKLRHHDGIDIALPEGTPVTPAAPGKVVFSGYSEGYGNCVIIEHENGLTSLYAHNSVNRVKAGDVVDVNNVIALSGATGRSTGPHLHFEVRKGGVAVDPARIIG